MRQIQTGAKSLRMSSFIHYKFKSAKDFDTYRFEGAGVPVWELKQEIVAAKKLGKGLDFDLVIINAQTNEGTSSIGHHRIYSFLLHLL